MSFFKKLFKFIAQVIAIIAIIIAIIAILVFSFGSAAGWLGILWYQWAALAFILAVVSAIISPEGFREVVAKVGDGVKSVTTAVGTLIGSAGSGLISGLSPSIKTIGLAAGAYLAFRYFVPVKDDGDVVDEPLDNLYNEETSNDSFGII